MRVYIPVTLTMLQQLVADGSLRPVNGTAFAVTPMLREAYAEGDEDELGEVALHEAALASLRLLAGASDGRDVPEDDTLPPRRAVLVAEVSEVTLRPDLDDAVVRIGGHGHHGRRGRRVRRQRGSRSTCQGGGRRHRRG